MSVTWPNGVITDAQCYNLPPHLQGGKTNVDYARKLAALAERIGLPAAYVADLRSLSADDSCG